MKPTRNSLIAAMAAVASLTVGGMARAQGSGGSGSPAQEDQPRRIEKVDRAHKTLAVTGMEKPIQATDATQVTKNGQAATFADIKPGDEVRASFTSDDPTHAQALEVTSPHPRGSPANKTN
jgi:hypothetical protein